MHAKKQGIKRGKLDASLATKGLFLGFVSTSSNAIYLDASTNETKTARHFVTDEAHYSTASKKVPHAKDLSSKDKPTDKFPASGLPTFEQTTALAAYFAEAHSEVLPDTLHLSTDAHGRKLNYHVKLRGDHPTLGMIFNESDNGNIISTLR